MRFRLTAALLVLPVAVTACGRNVRPGDRDYPVVDPAAHQAIRIDGKAPADWTVRLSVYYTTKSSIYDRNSPGEACEYDASGGLGAMTVYSVDEELPVTRQGNTFTATLFFDHFKPGRCGWHISDLNYQVSKNDGNPPTSGGLAASPRNHPGSPYNGDRMDLWCWVGQVAIGISHSKFDCTFSPTNLIPPFTRGNTSPLTILPTTKSLTFIFHDLAAESVRTTPPNSAPTSATAAPQRPIKGTISVISATYGGNVDPRFLGNATGDVKMFCDGKQVCQYQVRVSRLGDPAFGVRKNYSVQWTCGGSEELSADAPEEAGFGAAVTLSCGERP